MNASMFGPATYAWVYTDRSTVVRIVERPTADQRIEVTVDGPDGLRGRQVFDTRAEAAQSRARLAQQLAASGFVELWRSSDGLTPDRDW